MTASHLTALVAVAAVGNTVLAVAPRQGKLTDRLSFVTPASSFTTFPTARHAHPATAGLSSIADGPPTSADSRRPAPPSYGVMGASGRWVRRRRRDGHLRGEASEDGAAGEAGAAGTGSGNDVEEQEREAALAELERRQKKFTLAMKELGYTSRWKAVPVLIAEAGRVGLPLNVICLNAAMSVLARSGRWYEALDLLTKMRRGAALRDVAVTDSDRQGGSLGGNPVVERGTGGGKPVLFLPEPDTITFNAAISACGRGKKWKPAVDLLDTMRREGLTPDGFSYSTAISACKNCGQWETALEILEDMRRRGLGRDKHSLNAAIAACASAGRWEPATAILKGMEADGPDPDVFTYGSAIDALAQGGKLDLALQTLRRMRADPVRYPAPNTVCYNAALMALMRRGRWREARGLLTDVAATSRAAMAAGGGERKGEGEGMGGEGCSQPGADVLDFLSYNSVIRACAAAGEAQEALKTREEMRAAGIAADAYTYEALAAACGMAGEWKAAEAVVREMMAGCAEYAVGAGAGAVASTTGAEAATAAAAAMSGDAARAATIGFATTTTSAATTASAAEVASVVAGAIGRADTAAAEAVMPSTSTASGDAGTDTGAVGGDAAEPWNGHGGVAPAPAPSPPAGGSSSSSVTAATGTATAGGESWNQRLRHELRQRRRQEQLKNGVPPSPRVFHGLMEAYSRAGEWERALECLDDMLHGLRVSLEEEEQRPSGEGQERIGVRAGVKPDSTSVGWALQACATAGQWERALALFSGARSEGIPPGQLSYDAALLACAATGQGRRAASLLEEMASLEVAQPATYAAATAALADLGEWEWCLVLLEELEQLHAEEEDDDDNDDDEEDNTAEVDLRPPPPQTAQAVTTSTSAAAAAAAASSAEAESETVLQVELDEAGTPATTTTTPAAAAADNHVHAETLAAYTATVRACGEGRAGVKAVFGVLDRMRWAGVAPGEGTYAAAVSAFRACDGVWDGVQEGLPKGEADGGGLPVEGAARALIEHEEDRDGTGWASPFLYSAAIRACAEAGEIANGRRLFVEGRRAAGVASDKARDVAAAAVAAAAAATRSGTAPAAPARVNPGVEAVYVAALTLCAAAGDGTLARDVLRWMKLEGFQTTQDAYVLAIEACCTAAVREESPAAPPFVTPLPSRPSSPSPTPPTPQRSNDRARAEEVLGARRPLVGEEEEGRGGDRAVGDATQEPVAAAATAASPRSPPPEGGGGDASNGQGVAVGAGVEDAGGVSLGAASDASVDCVDAEEGGGEREGGEVGGKQPAGGGLKERPPPPGEEDGAERFGWVAIPGGRESPPEFDKGGEEVPGPAPGIAGATSMDGTSRYKGAGPVGGGYSGTAAAGGGGDDVSSVAGAPGKEGAGASASAAAAWREASAGMSVSPPAVPPAPSRAGAVEVLSPLAAATSTEARAPGGSDDERDVPRVVSAADDARSAPALAGAEPSAGESAGVGGGGGGLGGSGSGTGSLEKGIEWQRARAILDEMVAADHLPPPPAAAFRAVLGACDSAGRVGEALEVASAMVEAGHNPSQRLVARLMASHADVLDRGRREMEEAAAAPAENWGG
eukprot:g2377.t1